MFFSPHIIAAVYDTLTLKRLLTEILQTILCRVFLKDVEVWKSPKNQEKFFHHKKTDIVNHVNQQRRQSIAVITPPQSGEYENHP